MPWLGVQSLGGEIAYSSEKYVVCVLRVVLLLSMRLACLLSR